MSDVASASQPLSKRELKRQQKMVKEREQSTASPDRQHENGAVSPVEALGEELPATRPSVFLEPVQKRIRNYLKKKQKIDKLTELAEVNGEAAKLNADQLLILARKDQVLSPLKELQALADQFEDIDLQCAKQLKEESSERQKQSQEAIEDAKQSGYAQGKKLVESLVSFLGYASILRVSPTGDQEYDEATERLLSMFYEGGSTSMTAAENLMSGSEICIEGTTIPFARVATAMTRPDSSMQEAEELELAQTAAEGDAENATHAMGHLVSFGDVAERTKMGDSVGISFLNESEIEGSHAPEEPPVADPQAGLESAAQGLAETLDANQAGLTWNADHAKINWADDLEASDLEQLQSSGLRMGSIEQSMPTASSTNSAPDDFTQVEFRKRESGSRSRGRGERRDRGRGRGSRGRPAVPV